MRSLPDSPGIYDLVNEVTGLRYSLSIPQGYSARESAPLVVALHWAGAVTPFFGRGILEYLVAPGLSGLGALIAAPECRFSNWTNLRCENDVLSLIDYLVERYHLDASRVVLTGYSLGGTGVWYMAARRTGRYSAVIPISCLPHADIYILEWKVPIYVIHSCQDELIPYEQVEMTVQMFNERGKRVELDLLSGVTHYETDRFIAPLKKTMPWIRQVWKEQSRVE